MLSSYSNCAKNTELGIHRNFVHQKYSAKNAIKHYLQFSDERVKKSQLKIQIKNKTSLY